ncbi:cell growth regulator with EF hand domain protein 1 [Myripristis murdjan]|uniref:cell growth regulator with EF hand domain protein 1 n=1 Tax=Myripristis murdjan TaxID=586833 RepID=UPI001175DAC9|nr:cell growth regulator with EF hand domain protein 1 [Myripristis murdjan]
MQRGVPMNPYLDRLAPCVLSLVLLTHLSLAAPGVPGAQREESADAPPPSAVLANPFGPGEDDRRLLQSYIQASLKDGQGGPEISTWEQEVFFLFRLYDYDRSGHMDGLEMMKLLSDYNSHNAPGAQANEPVVTMVDFLLQTQDLNQDGLLAPSELLSPPLPHTQEPSDSNANHQGQDLTAEEKLSKPEEEKAGAEEQRGEETQEGREHEQKTQQEELELKEDAPPEHEVKTQDEAPRQDVEEQNGLQIPEQGQEQDAPVHQGQPEI